MKVLDVNSLEHGIDTIVQSIDEKRSSMKAIEKSILEMIHLDDGFKGNGASSIKSFYQDCHQPFLQKTNQLFDEYESKLTACLNSLHSIESSPAGFIRQSFLQNELTHSLAKANNCTEEITNEANEVIAGIQDIASIPNLDDSGVIQNIKLSKESIDQTVDQLEEFDYQQSASLQELISQLQMLNLYIGEMESKLSSGRLTIGNYSSLQLTGFLSRNLLVSSIKPSPAVLFGYIPLTAVNIEANSGQKVHSDSHYELSKSGAYTGLSSEDGLFANAFTYNVEGKVPANMPTLGRDIVTFNQIGGEAKGTLIDAGFKVGEFNIHQEMVRGEAKLHYGKVIGGEASAAATFIDLGVDHDYGKLHGKVGEAKVGVEVKDGHFAFGAKADLAKAEGEVKIPLPAIDWNLVIGGEAAYGSIGGEAQFGLVNEVNAGLGIGLGVKFGVEKD
ncbi:T7SS effector LXG polymorphic toxin [Peribacillus deserti]|uniref:LXG domain-containing protein n=1 Tax=Peribacillus deserti TaxID=673318 RepID=A0A2N5M8W7_9BACI|nr:T7SS effector LXG polymorphic toxin [Peribacillus deserti]PLT30785.1 hypothetical protein CUU66_06435 [Peribacillus deserti]